MTARKSATKARPSARPTTIADPEVQPTLQRRVFSNADKLRILAEADACTPNSSERGALLRREGIYSSHLTKWRRQRSEGRLLADVPSPRGPQPAPVDPIALENARLRAENARLLARLTQAETVIDVQKKVALLLGLPLAKLEADESC